SRLARVWGGGGASVTGEPTGRDLDVQRKTGTGQARLTVGASLSGRPPGRLAETSRGRREEAAIGAGRARRSRHRPRILRAARANDEESPTLLFGLAGSRGPSRVRRGAGSDWRACNTDPGRTSGAVFDCAAPGWAAIDLFGCFQVAVPQDSFIAMDCSLFLWVDDPAGPALDDFWHFES